MNILVVCQHYWPEPYPLQDLCEEFVRRGHTVHVVTDIPNYPMGVIYPEYRNGKNREQLLNGVKVTRVFTIGRRRSTLFRFLNYYSYAISSSLYAKRAREEYDVVFVNQTSPVMMASAAMTYARKWKKNVVLYCMDLWPACLAAGGVSEKSPIYKLFGRVSGKLYRQASRILITSQMFKEYLESEFRIDDEKIAYIPQYAAACFSESISRIDKDTVDLVFAGNIGAAQSIPTILRAAEILKGERNLYWHIIGEGSELENVKMLVHRMALQNVKIYGRKPLEEMPAYYAMADAMLVTLTVDRFISLTLPGKVQTYMAAGKPIIAAANGEIPNIIRSSQCGYCASAEDVRGLADAVRSFLTCANKAELGQNARAYYQAHFSRESFMDKLEAELMDQTVYSEDTADQPHLRKWQHGVDFH